MTGYRARRRGSLEGVARGVARGRHHVCVLAQSRCLPTQARRCTHEFMFDMCDYRVHGYLALLPDQEGADGPIEREREGYENKVQRREGSAQRARVIT